MLVLTDQQGEYPLGRYFDILEDPGGELTIEDVSSPEYAPRFVRSQVAVPNFGFTDSAYWLRLQLRNETSLTNQWLLEANFPNLNYIDLYSPSEQGAFIKKESGGLRKFETRDLPFYHVVFKQPLATRDAQTIYLRVESGGAMTLAFTLWSPEAFTVEKTLDMLWNGLFFGSLLMILGYHLVLLFSLREVVYFYFILVLASSILFTATYEGIADQFLWTGLSQEKLYFLVITMSLMFMALLKFSDVFLEQKTHNPRIHRLFYLFIGVWALMLAIVPFFSFGFMANLASILFIITPAFAVLAGFYSWRKRHRPAAFYLASWFGFLLGIILFDLVRLGLLPSTLFTEKFYQIGLIWLALLWSVALADRINLLKAQTEEANLALSKSESRLSQILEGLPLGVVVFERDQRSSYINKRTSEILSNPRRGIEPDPSSGRTLAQAINHFSFRVAGTDQPYPIEDMPITRALQGDPASVDDVEADLIDRRVPIEIWANPIKDGSGSVEQVVVAFQDITARKRAEAELQEYRNHLEQMVAKRTEELSDINEHLHQEMAERLLLEVLLHKRIQWLSAINRAHQWISGPADLELAFQDLSATIVRHLGASRVLISLWEEQNDRIKAVYRDITTDSPRTVSSATGLRETDPSLYEEIQQGRLMFLTADQGQAFLDRFGELTHNEEPPPILLAPMKTRRAVIGLLAFGLPQERFEDLSEEEVDLFERIALDLADLVDDASLLEKAQALAANEERNRLARELHDSVTQVLFSASLVAEVLPRLWKRDPETAERSLAELQTLTHGALAEMRTLLLELRPAAVVKSPLSELIAQLTEAITSRSGLQFQLFLEKIPALPEDVHVSFYRIAQEGLNNVVKHARASLVTVSLHARQDRSSTAGRWRGEVSLVIGDDGVGFPVDDESIGHMGLSIIRERARSINADVIITSQPGKGTELSLTWRN